MTTTISTPLGQVVGRDDRGHLHLFWSIAERVSPDGRDIRHTVDRLSVVTGGSLLHPGQRIVLPYG